MSTLSPTPPKEEYLECPYGISIHRNQVDVSTGEVVDEATQPIPCRCKTCPHCGPRLLKQMTAHYTRVMKELPNLKFLTLTIEFGLLDSPIEERKCITHIWSKFRKQLDRCCETSGQKHQWIRAIGISSSGHVHLHVVASIPIEEEELRQRWMNCGGGIVCEVRDIKDTEMLACTINYTLKNGFEDTKSARKQGITVRSISSSQGIGFYTETAKAERRRIVMAAETEQEKTTTTECSACTPGEFEAFLHHVLAEQPGQLVVTRDGPGSFVELAEGQACVLLEDLGITRYYPLLEVKPLGVEMPYIEIIQVPRKHKRRGYGYKLSSEERERFNRLQNSRRTNRYIHTDKAGHCIQWTYEYRSGAVSCRAL